MELLHRVYQRQLPALCYAARIPLAFGLVDQGTRVLAMLGSLDGA